MSITGKSLKKNDLQLEIFLIWSTESNKFYNLQLRPYKFNEVPECNTTVKQVDKKFIYAKTGNCEISLACDSELVLTFSKNEDKNSQFVYWILF